MRLSFLFKCSLHAKIIPANRGARQVQDYYNMGFLIYMGVMTLTHNTVIAGSSPFKWLQCVWTECKQSIKSAPIEVTTYSVTSTHLNIWARSGSVEVRTQYNDPQ